MERNIVMEKVISTNFLPNQYTKKGNGQIVLKTSCPWCGKRNKISVLISKNAFRCPACGEHGNGIKLHAKLNGLSIKGASKDLKSDKNKEYIKQDFGEDEKILKVADLSRRAIVNDKISRAGKLLPLHIENLLKRGLSKDSLKHYTSCALIQEPIKVFEKLPRINFKFLCVGEPIQIYGIPGIYGKLEYNYKSNEQKYNDIRFNLPSDGFLIPVITHEDENYRYAPCISCFQIRKDTGSTRYIYLSSAGKENGVSVTGCQKVHYTRNFWPYDVYDKNYSIVIPKNVFITEGALKADIAAELWDKPFIAVMGVNSCREELKKELKFLKEHGCEKIMNCYDMDAETNRQVAKAVFNLKKDVEEIGLAYARVGWDKKYKGIDDYLLAKKENRI